MAGTFDIPTMNPVELYNLTRHNLDGTPGFIATLPSRANQLQNWWLLAGGGSAAPAGGFAPEVFEARRQIMEARAALLELDRQVRAGVATAMQRGLLVRRENSQGVEVYEPAGLGALPLLVVIAIVAGVAAIAIRFIDHASWADALATYQNRRALAQVAIERMQATGTMPALPPEVFGGDASGPSGGSGGGIAGALGKVASNAVWVIGGGIALAVFGPALLRAVKKKGAA
jgi:hypothetical protein